MDDPHEFLRRLFDAAVAAATDFSGFAMGLPEVSGRVVVMAVGKAAPAMANGLLTDPPEWLDPARIEGFMVQPRTDAPFAVPQGWVGLQGDHPVPGQASAQAGRRLLEVAEGLKADDLLIALVSGGGSAMIAVPRPGVSLQDKILTARWLLASGRPISDVNAVRGALSAIKGGGLARVAAPARVATFVLSDVPGDAPWRVASGPTLAQRDPIPLLSNEDLQSLPASIRPLLAAGDPSQKDHPEDAVAVIGSGDIALAAAERLAHDHGLTLVNLGSAVQGEAKAVALDHARIALASVERGKKTLILSGGETTVQLAGERGCGGRNSEYALALALALDGHPAVHALAADTDGIDGTGPAAGALVHPQSLQRLRHLGLDASAALHAHDTYRVFEALGDAIITGPTGTNVNDFRAILILSESRHE